MMTIRKAADRGHANHGWLDTKHTFSFADYHDPKYMNFSVLRVINEDTIAGGGGFGTHSHRDMEIISYAVEGALEHKDSMGNSTLIKPGEVQRMSAGTGVQHSEFNHFKDKPTHFLQIWILPDKKGYAPSYGQKSFAEAFEKNDLVLVASQNGREGSVNLNQDIDLYACKSKVASSKKFKAKKNRHLWLQVIKGPVRLNGVSFDAGDGASLTEIEDIQLEWNSGSEFLFFDMV